MSDDGDFDDYDPRDGEVGPDEQRRRDAVIARAGAAISRWFHRKVFRDRFRVIEGGKP